jgi:hypothetical protein
VSCYAGSKQQHCKPCADNSANGEWTKEQAREKTRAEADRQVAQRREDVARRQFEQHAERAAEELVERSPDEISIGSVFTVERNQFQSASVTHSPSRRRIFVRVAVASEAAARLRTTSAACLTAWLQYRLSKSETKLEVQDGESDNY